MTNGANESQIRVGDAEACLLTTVIMAPSRGPHPIPRELHVVLNSHKGPVNVARYAKGGGKYILTGGQDRTVRLWNANSGAEIKAFTGHGYEVLSICVYVYLK